MEDEPIDEDWTPDPGATGLGDPRLEEVNFGALSE